jgi:hypothetical protein
MKTLLQLIFTLLLALPFAANSQEINCDVTIIPPRVMISGPEIFRTMETTIEEFINGRKWTKDDWTPEERIQCTMQITVENQVNQRQFEGNLQVSSSRPVYNSDYKTPILSLNDRDFDFTFQEATQIQWSIDQHRDNLSSVLAYYVYMILGMDYDSFALESGTEHYVVCQTIVSNAQNAAEPGWRASEKGQQNRFWLVDNLLSQTFAPIRECLYKYHRHGMDKMYTEVVNARKNMADALEVLRNIHKIKPSSYNMQVFFYAKADEVVNVFSPTEKTEKQPIVDLCKLLDPGNINKYDKMLQ